MAAFKTHLLTGKGQKQACGRGIGNSHWAVKWSEFKLIPADEQCEQCAASRVAALNKRVEDKAAKADDADADVAGFELDAWEPEDEDAWKRADDALLAKRR